MTSARQTNLLDSVFSPRPASGADDERKRRDGRFALQICVDTFAYAFNVPLRLALLEKGQDFPKTIRSLLVDATDANPIRKILREQDDGVIEGADADALSNTDHFQRARQMILALTGQSPTQPGSQLPEHWMRGMLAILPHVERQVWLTEIANPLPVHGICRMYDPWSLYILMWTSESLFAKGDSSTDFPDALRIPGLLVRRLAGTKFTNRGGEPAECVPVLGPIFEGEAPSDPGDKFIDLFEQFNCKAQEQGIVWGVDACGIPTHEELKDALQSRMALPRNEIERRAGCCERSLELLYSVELSIDSTGCLSRDFWERLATGVAWVAKSERSFAALLGAKNLPQARVIDLDDRSVLWVCASNDGRVALTIGPAASPVQDMQALCASTEVDHDSISAFFNRVRERQSAAWSSQIIAINNLLNRHDLSDKSKVPEDHLVPTGKADPEVGHLLRGFGNRVCRYLVSITRADVADLYWSDYAQSPPRLVNVGCYARLAEHRACAMEIESGFHEWAWKEGVDRDTPANQREKSPAQTYRSLALGQEDPKPGESITPFQSTGTDGYPTKNEALAYFESYPEPRPRDGLALPLMLNGRPVGVVSLAGLSERQFDQRIFIPLRRTASLLAPCMYHQSQLWHMRILNTFFINYQSDILGGSQNKQTSAGAEPHPNPLQTVARCLCNIFLCPVAHLWTRSLANPNRYELSGYNWQGIFEGGGMPGGRLAFSYQDAHGKPRSPIDSKFAELVVDLYRTDGNNTGKFVQGRFDYNLLESVRFEAKKAESDGTLLGSDMLDASVSDAPYRSKIFAPRPEGYGLSDIMSFPLLRRALKRGDSGEMEVVGIVTLHDWHRGDGEPNGAQARPWDRGWRTVVAHMQTYLPYLFEQVEILNNPLVDARRFLIHAGRAEIIGILDSTRRLREYSRTSLSPDGSVRRALARVLAKNFLGKEKSIATDEARHLLADNLNYAELALKDAWSAIQNLTDLGREQELVHLATIMHRYRDLAALSVELTDSIQVINLKSAVDGILAGFGRSLFERGVFKSNSLPDNIHLRLPQLWFRIVLGDLFHNAAKYATPGLALEVVWEGRGTLRLSNEGPYDPLKDDPKKLLLQGRRGSAAAAASDARYGGKLVGGGGQGIGLGGANTMCQLMGIGFEFEVRPFGESCVHATPSRARYEVKLNFPKWMLNKLGSVPDPEFA